MKHLYRFMVFACGFLTGTLQLGCNYACSDYGIPPADYKASGFVVDEAGTPISGIEVTFGNFYNCEQTVTTDDEGKFGWKESCGAMGEVGTVTARDVDGAANGEFADTEKEITFEYTGGKESDHCGISDYGNFEAKNVIIVMRPKGEESDDLTTDED